MTEAKLRRLTAVAAALLLSACAQEGAVDREAAIRDVLSPESEAEIRTACSTCHVFPTPDMLPGPYWATAVRGMYQIAEDRGIDLNLAEVRAVAWYLLNAPDRLPPAPGRTDAGPGAVSWELEDWWPADAPPAEERAPAVTHVQTTSLFGGEGLDVVVSDVSSNRVYALRPYREGFAPLTLGTVANPGRVTVTDLDGDGDQDVVVAALGELKPTNDPVGSVVWLQQTGQGSFEATTLADGLGRVADVQVADIGGDGRADLLVAVFGWMENGGLLWLEDVVSPAAESSERRHVLDARAGFTDVRVDDLDQDGRLDVIAVIAQEFQQVMVYWGEEGGFRSEVLFQAPNPDWGYTGLEVTDFTGNGLPDLIVTNGDNLDLTVAKPFHGVALLENQGAGSFEYRPLTAMYGAHRAVPVDLTGEGRTGLLVSAYLPPSVSSRAPRPTEALIWLERVGPTHLVRRVLKSEGVDHMAMDVGDVTGDGRPDVLLGLMDLGVVDPGQAHRGPPLTAFLTLWRNLGLRVPSTDAADDDLIDWTRERPGAEVP